jgi:hypothetical protein
MNDGYTLVSTGVYERLLRMLTLAEQADKWRALFVETATLVEAQKAVSDVFEVERDDDGSFIISDKVTLCYGEGKTIDAALLDYAETIIEYSKLVYTLCSKPMTWPG